MNMSERIYGVLNTDRNQDLEALRLILRGETERMLEAYSIVEDGPSVAIEGAGGQEYSICITAKVSRIVNIGKRII